VQRATARYAVRFFVALLTMETLIHVMHVVAIKDARAWGGLTPAQLSMIGFWNLIFVWLKVRTHSRDHPTGAHNFL